MTFPCLSLLERSNERYLTWTKRSGAFSLPGSLGSVSFSCLSNSRQIAQPRRCRVSGASGANDYAPTPHEWNKNWNSADGEGRRAAIIITEERIQNPRIILRQLLGQEERPAIRGDQEQHCQVGHLNLDSILRFGSVA